MCIRDNGRLAENIAQHKVCTLAADSGELQEFFHRIRNVIIIFLVQHLHAGGNIPGLAVAKPARLHNLRDLLHRRVRKSFDGWKLCIEQRRSLIHPFVRALCCEPHTHQQLPCIVVGKRAVRIRIFIFQARDNFERKFFFIHSFLPVSRAHQRISLTSSSGRSMMMEA